MPVQISDAVVWHGSLKKLLEEYKETEQPTFG